MYSFMSILEVRLGENTPKSVKTRAFVLTIILHNKTRNLNENIL